MTSLLLYCGPFDMAEITDEADKALHGETAICKPLSTSFTAVVS